MYKRSESNYTQKPSNTYGMSSNSMRDMNMGGMGMPMNPNNSIGTPMVYDVPIYPDQYNPPPMNTYISHQQDMPFEPRFYQQPNRNWQPSVENKRMMNPLNPSVTLNPYGSVISPPQNNQNSYPQINLVQRLSMLIKDQLPTLQPIMRKVNGLGYHAGSYNAYPKEEKRRRRSVSRSRSWERSRDIKRSNPKQQTPQATQWLCKKCSFSNYHYRENCKKCLEPHIPKGFVPGPQDWRCTKCGNINYARRNECNRCQTPK